MDKHKDATPNMQIMNDTVIVKPASDFIFWTQNNTYEFIRICENGDVFVKGALIENDRELYAALCEFFKVHVKALKPPKVIG